MVVFRIGTATFPVWDGAGAAHLGGRWNAPGTPVIYAAATLSLAMLERLVQETGFEDALLVEASVPDGLAVEDAFARPPANWNGTNVAAAQDVGQRWIASGQAAILRVPSVIVPRECNYVINPRHPAARKIRASDPVPLTWDKRLFIPRTLSVA